MGLWDMTTHIFPPSRILLGPGPSNVHPRAYQAMMAPVVGYLDPVFFDIMAETQDLLRFVFQTRNRITLPLSGTGGSGMEACLTNLLAPGDRAIVCVCGFFGARMCEIVDRCGATAVTVESDWGMPIDPADVENALKKGGARLVAVVHAETSTGLLQPIEDISRIARRYGALLVVDAVTSLGGCDFRTDEWGVDASYSVTQKCLAAPPGLSPVTLSPEAVEAIAARRNKVRSWYLDLALIARYWDDEHAYHHTPPASMIYALREALIVIREEGLGERFSRHLHNQRALTAGLEAMGLDLLVGPAHRLPSLTTVRIPDGVPDVEIRRALLDRFQIEIGGGFGPLKGRIWRVGLMGCSSSMNNVVLLLSALEQLLRERGVRVGSGVRGALEV